MAKASEAPKSSEPLAELTDKTRKILEDIGDELARAEEDMAALEELGLDTSRLREKIEWGKKARKVILDRYSK
jgi:hypothetical protein